MKRVVLVAWRIGNYALGLFGLLMMLEASSGEVQYDEFGNTFTVNQGIGRLAFGFLGLLIVMAAGFSSAKNKKIRQS